MKKLNYLCIITLLFLGLVFTLNTGCTKTEDLPDGSSAGTVKDKDGNVYQTVKIGTQVWMVENLKTTKYNNGDPINNVSDNKTWSQLSTGAWCNYDNDVATGNKYGKLYNWYAVKTGNLAPSGWHVPTEAEWEALAMYVTANSGTSGNLAKALAATTDWASSTNASTVGNSLTKNNSSGFSALPGGDRDQTYSGQFYDIGKSGYWWSFDDVDSYARCISLDYNGSTTTVYGESGNNGLSVRLIKDYTHEKPTVVTDTISKIDASSATCCGTITANGGDAITANGVCWKTSANPTITDNITKDEYSSGGYSYYGMKTNIGGFTSLMTNLKAGTKYYVKAYATNSLGTTYGAEVSFTTQNGVIGLTTNAVMSITASSATIGGTISNDGGASIVTGGVCWSTTPNPTIALSTKTTDGTGIGTFSSLITGLNASTKYYVKAYATNSLGTSYGNEVSFTTTAPMTVTDIDGNLYHAVTIGTQVWMVENLKTTKYKDGTSIPLVTDATAWGYRTTAGYCWYINDADYKNTYGALYNWYTVNTGKLAPIGWHVPTNAEWTILENYVSANLGTSSNVAKALAATTDWAYSSYTGDVGNDLTKNNTSGFTALPGGYRYDGGAFGYVGLEGDWWSSTEGSATNAWYRDLDYYDNVLTRDYYPKSGGFSVRCVRDN